MNKVSQEFSEVATQMQAYIKEHLQEPLTSSSIAKAVGYSQYHAARMFKGETGLSPFEYVRRERLISSAHSLRNGKPKVLDVALDFVFDSHEGFTRAFSNAFGISPKKYAMHPVPDGWLIPYRYLDRRNIKMEDTEVDTKTNTAVIFTQIMERPERKLILKRSKNADDYFSYCEEIGCGKNNDSEAWDILSQIKEALYEPAGVWLPGNMRNPSQGEPADTGIYAHGVEVPSDYAGEIPEGFDVIDLKPCKMLIFQGEPYDDKSFDTAVGVCMERISSFNPEVYGYKYADELAPKMQLKPQGWRGYIEMRPVKEM